MTIVSGVPRSGTSMMMRMVSAGGMTALIDGVRGSDEDNPLGYFELEAVKRTKRDASWLAAAGGKVVKVVHILLLDLPTDRDYRVIFMRRDLDEVIRSQNAMLARNGESPGTLTTAHLRTLFEAQLRRVDAYLASQPCFRVLPVEYDAVVADPARAAAAINAFLGGMLDEAAMAGAVQPALYRQRAPAEGA